MKKFGVLVCIMFTFQFAGAQWVQTNGTKCPFNLSVMQPIGDTIIGGTYSYGLFMSLDDGYTWTQPTDFFNSIPISSFAFTQGVLFAGTFEKGIYASDDYGLTWSWANNGISPDGLYVTCMALHDDYLFAGTLGGIFRSSDGGLTWSGANNGITNYTIGDLLVGDSVMYAITSYSIFSSFDKGESWQSIFSITDWHVRITAAAADGAGIAFATNESSSGIPVNEMLVSQDYGATWKIVAVNLFWSAFSSIAISGDSIYAITTYEGIHLSTDFGATWQWVDIGSNYQEEGGSVFFSTTDIYILANGMYRSRDHGNSWSWSSYGLQEYSTVVSAVAAFDSTILGSASCGKLYRSENHGDDWIESDTGLPNTTVRTLLVSGTNIFAGTEGGGVYLSGDGGHSWVPSNVGIEYGRISSLAEAGTILYAGTAEGVYRSTDHGTSWQQKNTGLSSMDITSLAAIGQYVYAGSWDSGVFMSDNNGDNWQPVLPFSPIKALMIYSQSVYAGTGIGIIYKAALDGAQWDLASNGLPGSVMEINAFGVHGPTAYVGTMNGIYQLNGSEGKWVNVSNGLTHRNVHSITFGGAMIYVGTWEGGVYRNEELLSSITEMHIISYDLLITPNPASTFISFSMDETDSRGFLQLYNLSGGKVGERKVSTPLATIDISYLPDGVYVVRFTNDQAVHIGKFVKE